MASNFTKNYKLNQWEPEDKVVRTDFNTDNAKIDAALSKKADKTALDALAQTVTAAQAALDTRARCAAGSYTGNGAGSLTLNVGFRPKALLIRGLSGDYERLDMLNGGVVSNSKMTDTNSKDGFLSAAITDTGVTIQCTYNWSATELARAVCNTSRTSYVYVALG